MSCKVGCFYIYCMLIINCVKVRFEKNVIPMKIRTVKISYRESQVTTTRKYRQTNTHAFDWHQDLTLPLYYNVPLIFHCFTEPSNNPEDNTPSVLTCQIRITDYRATTENGIVNNPQGKQVAIIQIDYKVQNEKLILPEDKGHVAISSVLAHLDQHHGTSGFVQIGLGSRQLATPTVSVIAGELLWGQALHLPVQDRLQGKYLQFYVHVDGKIVGKGSFPADSLFKTNKKYRKIELISEQEGHKIGILFLDVVYKIKSLQEAQNTSQTVEKQGSKLKASPSFSFQKRQSSLKTLLPSPIKQPSASQKQAVGSSRSERFLPQVPIIEQKPKRGRSKADIFAGVFNMGDSNQPEQIRSLLKQRRQKKQGLPKLK